MADKSKQEQKQKPKTNTKKNYAQYKKCAKTNFRKEIKMENVENKITVKITTRDGKKSHQERIDTFSLQNAINWLKYKDPLNKDKKDAS